MAFLLLGMLLNLAFAILTLQTSLTGRFGSEEDSFGPLMTMATSTAVCVLNLILGIRMLRKKTGGTRRLTSPMTDEGPAARQGLRYCIVLSR